MTYPNSPFTLNDGSNNNQDDKQVSNKKPKGVKKTYLDITKALLINDFNLSKLSIEEYCTQEDKPSAATLRKWLKANKPECPECNSLKLEVVALKAKLSVYERNS
ncbi:hypothetical protein [Thiothrix fructosivorans]|uniref:Uncharacterized protein n=1 Tax=Thiothrix fructosivorans TaxID=111770 RepID=A0A8B0SGF8_9GAMM|nr:hypothetical protein [Thiothrix fructosivorans]MBO0615133.1 hypothetical protein [Thiothrix fructosivorans]QTX09925.1 hypothetical protein J1836_015125 [Thiothrix fructosivorans]